MSALSSAKTILPPVPPAKCAAERSSDTRKSPPFSGGTIRQPSEGLFNERVGSESCGFKRSAGADAVRREVFFAQRDGDNKSATFSVNAFNSNGSTVQLGEFLNQRETDASPFEGTSP